MVQVDIGTQVGTREVICSQFEVIGPVEEAQSIPAFIYSFVRGPVAAFRGVQAMEVLSLVVQEVTVKVSAVEVM